MSVMDEIVKLRVIWLDCGREKEAEIYIHASSLSWHDYDG